MEPMRTIRRDEPCAECASYSCPDGDCNHLRYVRNTPQIPREPKTVNFTLPDSREQWQWPLEQLAAVDALCEILDRAGISWTVADTFGRETEASKALIASYQEHVK